MLVSVVLSTRNRANRLAITLDSFSRCRLPAGDVWEVVVADNGSSDSTAEVLSAWAERIPLRRIWVPEPGLSCGRNAALEAARGELLVFTDDDVLVPAEWLAEYLRAYRALGENYYFGGPIDSEFESGPPATEWARLAPASVVGLDWGSEERELRPQEFFIGPNWACAAAPVRKAGGFNPRMGLGATDGPPGGEEIELMERLAGAGLRGWYLPTARIRHWVPVDKTSVEHLKARWHALAAVRAWKGTTRYSTNSTGVAWSFYPALARAALRRLAARAGLADRIEAEMEYVWYRGLWAGFRLPPRTRTED